MQVSVSRSVEEKRIIPAYRTSLARRAKELATYRKHLYADAEGVFFGIMTRISPFVIAVPDPLFSKLQQLHILLGRVFIDIVDRWFTDENARFPERMPLDPSEEALLRWVSSSGCAPDYPDHGGIWRSDLLFGRSPDGLDDESPYVCEINGRLPLNAVTGIALGENGLRELGASKGGLETVNTMEVRIIYNTRTEARALTHVQLIRSLITASCQCLILTSLSSASERNGLVRTLGFFLPSMLCEANNPSKLFVLKTWRLVLTSPHLRGSLCGIRLPTLTWSNGLLRCCKKNMHSWMRLCFANCLSRLSTILALFLLYMTSDFWASFQKSFQGWCRGVYSHRRRLSL
jgi:hypothetical protein